MIYDPVTHQKNVYQCIAIPVATRQHFKFL